MEKYSVNEDNLNKNNKIKLIYHIIVNNIKNQSIYKIKYIGNSINFLRIALIFLE